jgi:hypothetical protein
LLLMWPLSRIRSPSLLLFADLGLLGIGTVRRHVLGPRLDLILLEVLLLLGLIRILTDVLILLMALREFLLFLFEELVLPLFYLQLGLPGFLPLKRVLRRKDIVSAGLVGAYSEVSGFKALLDHTYDGLKKKGLSASSDLVEALSIGDGVVSVYSEAKSLGAYLVSETYLAFRSVGAETRTGLREGFSDILLANRTRGTMNWLTHFMDSLSF